MEEEEGLRDHGIEHVLVVVSPSADLEETAYQLTWSPIK